MEYLTPGEIIEKIEDYVKTVKKEIKVNNVSGMSKEYLIEKFADWLDTDIRKE